MANLFKFYLAIILFIGVRSFKLPGECLPEQFFDPGSMECQNCLGNASMVSSPDGFGCSCQHHSIPAGVSHCRPCNATEMVSEDGLSCVSRRCQVSSGRIVCRKCPNDYISVTQAFDGSPLKEVLCVKCTRGYKVQDNKCVKCDACVCNKNEIVVRGTCVQKKYVNERPKYEENVLHPSTLLEIVKQEYLCTKHDLRACRTLARMCVKSFYSSDAAGPCRLWLQPNLVSHKGLPQLTIPSSTNSKTTGNVDLPIGQNQLRIVMAVHTRYGGLRFLNDTGQKISDCFPPFDITISRDETHECQMNASNIDVDYDEVYELYTFSNGDYRSMLVSIIKPNGYHVMRGMWPSGTFKNFFALDSSLSTTANMTNTVYLRSFKIKIQIERDKNSLDSLNLKVLVTLQYATKSPLSNIVTITLNIENEMPTAGMLRGLEIWGSLLATKFTLYAIVQWRGIVRRGGLHVALIPLLAGELADALYFAVLFSTIYALSATFGTLGIILPLSKTEETVIRALLYTVVCLKVVAMDSVILYVNDQPFPHWVVPIPGDAVHADASLTQVGDRQLSNAAERGGRLCLFVACSALSLALQALNGTPQSEVLKVLWVNWCQCRCDIFFIDWSEYNPPLKGPSVYEPSNQWKAVLLANEWISMQTKRRASPGFTVTLTLVVLHLMSPWHSYLPRSEGYKWAVGMVAWWSAYTAVLLVRWVYDKLCGPPTTALPKVCRGVGLSMLVFQEELYAHYVHGRCDDTLDSKLMAGPLAMCRVVCAPQLRAVYKKLSTPGYGNLASTEPNRILLTRFLAAFFERALDGLSWVGSERTTLERLVDVELTAREGGATSALLYDPETTIPSCFSVTWWGEEWSLATFDAMLFGCVLLISDQPFAAAVSTLIAWQVMKILRTWLGNKNIREKIEIEI